MAEIEKGYNLMQVAEALGVKVRTVRSWAVSGKIKATKIPGTSRWVVSESEVKRLRGIK